MKISERLHYVGIPDPELDLFDIYMKLERGTSYNSYLLLGSEKNALIELVNDTDFNYSLYLENIKKALMHSEAEPKIHYLVLHHTEMDHILTTHIRDFFSVFPDITVICSATAATFLPKIWSDVEFSCHPVKDHETLDLGGVSLTFRISQFIHWPDTMISYSPEIKALFCCDLFGSHYCTWGEGREENLFLSSVLKGDKSEVDTYVRFFKYYYAWIMAPFNGHVRRALGIINDLPEIRFIGTSHGPVIDGVNSVRFVIRLYLDLSKARTPKRDRNGRIVKRVLVAYITAHKQTEIMLEMLLQAARTLKFGYSFNGKEVREISLGDREEKSNPLEMIPVNLDSPAGIEKATGYLTEVDGLIVGTPTLLRDAPIPVWQFLAGINPVIHSNIQLFGAFGSYGWSGEATINVTLRMASMNTPTIRPLRVQFSPLNREKEISRWFLEYVSSLFQVSAAAEETEFSATVRQSVSEVRQLALRDGGTEESHNTKEEEETVWVDDGVMREWKCIVCGEIVQSVLPPDYNCPVCGVDPDCWVFVSVIETTPVGSNTASSLSESGSDLSKRASSSIVIIGGSAAGTAAAREIRNTTTSDIEIIIITGEPFFPYYRPRINEMSIYKKRDFSGYDKEFHLLSEEYLERENIRLILNATVTKILTKENRVVFRPTHPRSELLGLIPEFDSIYGSQHCTFCEGGESSCSVGYTKLIISTGTFPVFPPTNLVYSTLKKSLKRKVDVFSEGRSNYVNAFSFYGFLDLFKLRRFLDARESPPENVVLVGGGPLSLEILEMLRGLGVGRIYIVEDEERLLSKYVDVAASRFLETELRRKDVKLFLGYVVKKYHVEKRVIRSVVLADGESEKVTLGVDMIVFSTGVKSSTGLSKNIGARVGVGIKVDKYMRTSIRNIYACGDCVEVDSFPIRSWNYSVETGRLAGRNIVRRDKEPFLRLPKPFLVNVFGMYVYSCGITNDRGLNIETISSTANGMYVNLFFKSRNGSQFLVGAVYVGYAALSNKLTKAINERYGLRQACSTFVIFQKPVSRAKSVHKYSLDFLHLSEDGLKAFREFLSHEFNEELLDFVMGVINYHKTSRKKQRKLSAETLYKNFIDPKGPKPLNLSDTARKQVIEKYKSKEFTMDMFDPAYEEAKYLLENDQLFRFYGTHPEFI